MKIKIVYGVDMRLWRYNLTQDKPSPSSYQDLLKYITTTFEFDDIKQFRITFKDDDDEQTTMASQEDFEDAFTFAKKSNQKSLKLYIVDTAEPHYFEHKESKEEIIDNKESKSEPIPTSNINNNENEKDSDSPPSEEEINAFISDDFTMDLLSDLFISVFEALQASNFEVSFIECVEGILLSNNDKYIKLTSNKVWPYFMKTLLPNISNKIEKFMIPMIKMNGINSEMIKQWIPTLFNMMKYHHKKKGGFCGGKWKGKRHCRGGRGGHWRGRHHRGHHGGHHRGHHRRHHGGHHHEHEHEHGHEHGHHGHWRGGWRGRGGFGWGYQQPHWNYGMHGNNDGNNNGNNNGYQRYEPSAPQMNNGGNEDDQIEQEAFSYTEELVQIMNMGFTNMSEIKRLLSEHKGNKQLVVQELVSAQNK